SVHNEHALQIANSIDSDKLALRLPSCAEQSGLPGIRPRKNSSSQTARCASTFLSERVGFDDGEQLRCLWGVEKEEKLCFTGRDSVRLVSEIAGNRSSHDVKRRPGKPESIARIRPCATGRLIAESGI